MNFKLSKFGLFLQKLPKFSAVHASNLVANVSYTFFVATPMSLALETMLDNVPNEARKDLGDASLIFIKLDLSIFSE